MDEHKDVVQRFSDRFDKMKNEEMVIYGIGVMTKAILEVYPCYKIVGLMDETRAGESIYGKPILSEKEVKGLGVKTIIIVATANNTDIIFRRIMGFCADSGINVYSIDGRLLSLSGSSEKSFEKYKNVSYECLQEKIRQADVISFDIFDTVIMRKTLYPRDVFHIVAHKTGNVAFYPARIRAETELYRGKDIYHIYRGVAEILGLNDQERDELLALELEIEKSVIVPRKSVVRALEYALSLGKAVYFVSDMYLPGERMCELMASAGIFVRKESIIVSCDYGTWKDGKLFAVLREKAGDGRILHLGDNFDADVLAARKNGMDDAFQVYGAAEMLADSYCEDLLMHTAKLADRLMIGRFIAIQLNDPFLFSKTNGKLRISENYELGYSFFAPIVFSYLVWLREQAKKENYDYLFCSSRDGWLIKRIIEQSDSMKAEFPPLVYYYTSRVTAMRSMLESANDILEVMKTGKPQDILVRCFSLSKNDIIANAGENFEEYVLKHKKLILEAAEQTRSNNRKYLHGLRITGGSKIGYIDFASSGTTQLGLESISDFDITGLYMLRFYRYPFEIKKNALKIRSLFGSQSIYFSENGLARYYIELENILSSFEPTVADFNGDGMPVFMPERRKPEYLSLLHEIHVAIQDYCREFEMTLFEDMTSTLAEKLYSYLAEQHSIHKSSYFDYNTVYDDVPNRVFKVFDKDIDAI